MTDAEIAKTIETLENARGRALVEQDWDTLSALVADDVVHIHANGTIENKAAYLDGVKTKLVFLKISRPILQVRVYGDVAIATGVLEQTVRVVGPDTEVAMTAAATQSWHRRGNSWVQTGFQATRIG